MNSLETNQSKNINKKQTAKLCKLDESFAVPTEIKSNKEIKFMSHYQHHQMHARTRTHILSTQRKRKRSTQSESE